MTKYQDIHINVCIEMSHMLHVTDSTEPHTVYGDVLKHMYKTTKWFQ